MKSCELHFNANGHKVPKYKLVAKIYAPHFMKHCTYLLKYNLTKCTICNCGVKANANKDIINLIYIKNVGIYIVAK